MESRSDRVAAVATGVGAGLIALTLVWLAGNRLAATAWEPPVGPIVALTVAVLLGAMTATVIARRLLRENSETG